MPTSGGVSSQSRAARHAHHCRVECRGLVPLWLASCAEPWSITACFSTAIDCTSYTRSHKWADSEFGHESSEIAALNARGIARIHRSEQAGSRASRCRLVGGGHDRPKVATPGDFGTLTTASEGGRQIRSTGLRVLRRAFAWDGTPRPTRRRRSWSCDWSNTLFNGRRLHYGREMSIATQFIAELQRERRSGNVSSETEQHLKHEFRTLGRDASESRYLAAAGTSSKSTA